MSGVVRQVSVVLAYLATLFVNYLAVSLPLGGHTTAEIANRYPIYFLPANFTFGIWGVIYLALGVYAASQARPLLRNDRLQQQLGYLFILSCVGNIAWLICFQSLLFPASMVAMLFLLAVLIIIYERLGVGRRMEKARERWLTSLPFSIYLGWISVATIANASYVLYDAHWDGWGISGQTWAVIMLAVGAVLATIFITLRRDVAYALVVCWAFAGIAIKQAPAPLVSMTAAVLATALLVLAMSRFLWRRMRKAPLATVG